MNNTKDTMYDKDFAAEMPDSTHNILCSEGRYAGQRYTRLPILELRRLSRKSGIIGQISSQELERRGCLVHQWISIFLSTPRIAQVNDLFAFILMMQLKAGRVCSTG